MKKRLNGWFVEMHQMKKEEHEHSNKRNPIHFPEFKISQLQYLKFYIYTGSAIV